MDKAVLNDFVWVGQELLASGLIDSHGGNMSVRDGDKIFITRRGCRLGNLTENDIIEVPLSGESPADHNASRELIVHRAIYSGTDAKAIVHAHGAYSVALSITENKIIPQDAEGTFFLKGVSIVRARDTIGSAEVARLISPLFGGNPAVMVRGHGSFTKGKNLEEAYQYTSCLENTSRIVYLVKSLNAFQQQQIVQQAPKPQPQQQHREPRRAIPPSIGVMDRNPKYGRGRGGL
jgi:L-fuculose-phosphate aldolase